MCMIISHDHSYEIDKLAKIMHIMHMHVHGSNFCVCGHKMQFIHVEIR